nr:arginine--tRNA ligase, cytoplasmic-like isoform X1 [Tanacetum cinerariifolium]
YRLVSTRLNVIDKWMTLSRRRRIPKNKSCRLGLDLSGDGKGFQTRSIEVVKLIDLLDEAKTPKATLVERGYGVSCWCEFGSFSCSAIDDYYTRYRRHPRIVAWSSKHKFYRHMLKPMLRGQLPVERLVPDETEARSRWWVSSRAYFDGRSFEDKHIPRYLNRNNYFEVPSEMYREFEKQRRGYQ